MENQNTELQQKRECPTISAETSQVFGMQALLEIVGRTAVAVPAAAMLLSILYNFRYFNVVRPDLLQLLSVGDYIVTAIRVISLLAIGALIAGIASAGANVVTSLFIHLTGASTKAVFRAAVSEKAGEIASQVAITILGLLIISLIAVYYFRDILDWLARNFSAILTVILNVTLDEVMYGVIFVTVVLLVYSATNISSVVKFVGAMYFVLGIGTYLLASRQAKADLENLTPSFFIRIAENNSEVTKPREVILMRSLERVVLLRFVGTQEVTFIEWQTFQRGWFNGLTEAREATVLPL